MHIVSGNLPRRFRLPGGLKQKAMEQKIDFRTRFGKYIVLYIREVEGRKIPYWYERHPALFSFSLNDWADISRFNLN